MSTLRTSLAVALLFACATPAAAAAKKSPSIVTPETVRLIESQVVLPRGIGPLSSYDRYYMLRTIPARPVGNSPRRPVDFVEGRFMHHQLGRRPREGAVAVPGIPGAFTIARGGRLPQIADGGCLVVTIFFDLKSRTLVSIVQEGREADPPEIAVCNGHG
jgi:hypothetical protein